MKRTLWVCALLGCLASSLPGQFVLNGGFTNGTTNWGCTPELNPETVYGGSNGANVVAEIDNLVSLCQTINGLTVGTVYDLRYFASRRLGGCPGPNPANIGVSIAGLNTIDARSNTVWALTPSTYQFTATATSHTLSIVQQFAAYTTCGFIIDDIEITAAIPFVAELSAFDLLEFAFGAIEIQWTTEQEHNLKALQLERSGNGFDWTVVTEIPRDGDQDAPSKYRIVERNVQPQTIHYRLLSIDNNGQVSELGRRQLERRLPDKPIISQDRKQVRGLLVRYPGVETATITWVDVTGATHPVSSTTIYPGLISVDTEDRAKGVHLLCIRLQDKWFVHKLVVE